MGIAAIHSCKFRRKNALYASGAYIVDIENAYQANVSNVIQDSTKRKR